MNNHPFYSTNTNIYDESFCNSTPTNLNGQNVIVSQEQQRKLFDSLNTAIVGFPNRNGYVTPNFCPGSCIQAGKQYVPGGVQFFFMPRQEVQQQQPQRMYNYNPTNQIPSQFQEACFCANTLEQQMAMNSLAKHGLESLEYQQQLSGNPFFPQYQQQNLQHPFQLKFHQNVGTSTNLLNVGSKSTPDFCNMGGFMQMQAGARSNNSQDMETNGFDTCACMKSANNTTRFLNQAEAQFEPSTSQNGLSSNGRKLVISKTPEPFTGHVVDALNEGCDPCKKKVTFSDDNVTGTVDQTGQKKSPSKLEVISDDMNQVPKEDGSGPKENVADKVDQSEQASFPCECSVGNNSRCETSQPKSKPKRSVWPKRWSKGSGGSESGSSESEKQKKPSKTKRKKTKKKSQEDECTTSESE